MATQIERVTRRPGWTHESAEQVIGGQARRSTRRAIADAVIFNDGITLDGLQSEVLALWSLWQPQP
jgi:dephospho-CoA kinase